MNNGNHHTDEYVERSRVNSKFAIQSNVTVLFLFIIIIFVVYSNTLGVPWHFDDQRNIVERQELHLTKFSWQAIKDTFYYENRLYRPVACLSFALNYYFHELDLAGYHLVNIAVHVLAAWFLFLFIRITLQGSATYDFYRNKAFFIAFLASFLWAVHPIQTQSVTYIVQRMASMAGMFYIMSMYFYARARIQEHGRNKCLFFLFSFLAALLALGSKENAILIPFSILLYEMIVLNDSSIKNLLKYHWKPLLFIVAVVLIGTLGYMELIRGKFFGFTGGYQHRVFSLEERLLTQPRIIIFYISLLLYPHPSRLSICHDFELSKSLFQPVTTILSIAAIVLLVAGALILRRKCPFPAFSVLFFFLNHAVESTLIPLELVFEHRNYIPSMLFFLPFAMLFAQGLFRARKSAPVRGCLTALVMAAAFAMGSTTYLRNFDWKTEKTLWLDAAAKSPNTWRPFHNIGAQFMIEEDYPQALIWFQAALSKQNTTIHAEKHQTLYSMGVAYQSMGLTKEALNAYRQADRVHPGVAKVHLNRGVILLNQEDWAEALDLLNEALSLDPSLPEAHSNLGWLLFKSGDTEAGIQSLRKSVNLNPNALVTVKRLAYVLLCQGNLNEAEELFKNLRKSRPADLSSLLFLAEIYEQSGRNTKARSVLRLVGRLLGENGLSALKQLIIEQQNHPSAFTVNKELLIPIIETLEVSS